MEPPLYPNHNHLSRRRSCLIIFIPLLPISFGWKNYDRWYYGVRFARNCHPDDLWSTYFTSSKQVKAFRQQHGEPDVIEVRQTFNDSLQAREWEHKVLKRLKVIHNDKWLNLGTGKSMPPMLGLNHWTFGKGFSEEHKQKISESLKRKAKNRRNKNTNKCRKKRKALVRRYQKENERIKTTVRSAVHIKEDDLSLVLL